MRVLCVATTGLALVLLAGCAFDIGPYNEDAYKNATSLKAEAVAMVDKSGEAYSSHASEADALSVKIDAAYEFSAGTNKSSLSALEWDKIRINVYRPFVANWKKNGTIAEQTRCIDKVLTAENFDYLICLEANKKAHTNCPVPSAEATSACRTSAPAEAPQ